MKFNHLVYNLLNEYALCIYDPTTLPVHDGHREVYCVTLSLTPSRFGYNNYISRLNQLLDGWDEQYVSNKVYYKGTSYEQALNTFTHTIELNMDKIQSRDSVLGVIDLAGSISHLIGTWKVLEIYNSLYIGVEVNLDAYKASSHAAGDLYEF